MTDKEYSQLDFDPELCTESEMSLYTDLELRALAEVLSANPLTVSTFTAEQFTESI